MSLTSYLAASPHGNSTVLMPDFRAAVKMRFRDYGKRAATGLGRPKTVLWYLTAENAFPAASDDPVRSGGMSGALLDDAAHGGGPEFDQEQRAAGLERRVAEHGVLEPGEAVGPQHGEH